MEYIHTYLTDDECDQVLKAFELADKAHEGQFRASGEPYIMHPLAVADILAHLQIDHITLMAALMHDVVEDTSYSKEDLEEMFGSEVAFLVDGVTKLNQFQYETKEDRQMENYRKMILAMAKDVRVVVIKLGDRLHNMRTLKHMRSDKQKRIAKETLDQMTKSAKLHFAERKPASYDQLDHPELDLASLDKAYDKLEREESSKATIASWEADLAVTSQRNDEKVQQAMTDKRAALVDEIVEKVVATYGN